jgi:N-acetylglucosaminyldiphosphoundecaprenol N-acetyl-beta-D-mannosaminyltransferase
VRALTGTARGAGAAFAVAPDHRYVLATRVDATNYADAAQRIVAWARRGESRYVCAASVHTVMEAYDCVPLRHMINSADLIVSDGMPLVWALRALGVRSASRVYGPELTVRLLRSAAAEHIAVGFYGGTPAAAARLVDMVRREFPGVAIVYSATPPFRPLTPAEDDAEVEDIVRSRARIVFVGLGCPKQDRWIAEHLGRVPAVMVGVGAAFDFLAGVKLQAPAWIGQCGLEWLFRLCTEPRRLWRRYLRHGPRFVVLFGLQRLGVRRFEIQHE